MKIWRLILLTAIIFGLAALVHILAFGLFYSRFNINATFVVGIIIFLPSLIVVTGEPSFHIGYVRLLFSKNAKNEFPTYRDYKNIKLTIETSF